MAAASAATSGESARRLGRSAVGRSIRRAENRQLNRVSLPRALRAGNLLRLVQHNLLEVHLAILTNVFVNRHFQNSESFSATLIITGYGMRSEMNGRSPTSSGTHLTRNHIASPIVQLKKKNNPTAVTSKYFLSLPSANALMAIAGNDPHDPTEIGHEDGDTCPPPCNSVDHSITIV